MSVLSGYVLKRSMAIEESMATEESMERRYISVSETAVYLGLSIGAIRKWIRMRSIPFCRLNGAIRFDIQEIERWAHKR